MQQEIPLEEARRRLNTAESDKNEAKQRLNTAEQKLNTLIETEQLPSYFSGSKTDYFNSFATLLNNAQATLTAATARFNLGFWWSWRCIQL